MLNRISPQYKIPDDSLLKPSESQVKTTQENNEINLNQNNQQDKPVNPPIQYDYAIIESDTELEKLFSLLNQQSNTQKIVHVTETNDLYTDNLIKKTHINEANNGKIISEEGLLFADNSNEEVTLVVDFRKMPASLRVELNDLYVVPPKLGKKVLKGKLKIISVIDRDLITGKNNAESDFWRRIAQSKIKLNDNFNKPLKTYTNSDFFNCKFQKSTSNTSNNNLIIDLNNKDWRTELFGSPDINTNGNKCFIPGKLNSLTKNQHIILKNAPWDNHNFRNELRKVIESGSYIANRQKVTILNDVTWERQDSDAHNIAILKQNFNLIATVDTKTVFQEYNNVAVLNNHLLLASLNTTGISFDGELVKYNALANLVGNANALLVTAKLSGAEWIQLLNQLKAINKQNIPIIQADPELQDKTWQAEQKITTTASSNLQTEPPSNQARIKIEIADTNIINDNSNLINNSQPKNQQPLVIQFSPDTNLTQACTTTRISNLADSTFTVKKTAFLNALISGYPLEIRGLENNLSLLSELETILGNPPVLFVNGIQYQVDQANITIILPPDTELPSNIWQSIIPTINNHVVNLNEIKSLLQQKYNLNNKDDSILSDKMVDQVKELITLINSTPKDELTPKNKIELNENLFDLIWSQALTEQKINNNNLLSIDNWHKAINTVLLKKYRGNSEIFNFFKRLTKYYFSKPDTAASIDVAALNKWIANHDEINLKLIEENFWQLLKFMPDCNLLINSKQINKIKVNHKKYWNNFFFKALLFFMNISISFFTASSLIMGISQIIIFALVIYSLEKSINWYFGYNSDYVKSDLDETPDSAPISMQKNSKYIKMLEVLKTTLVACAPEKKQLQLKQSLEVSNHNLNIIKPCIAEWVNIDYSVQKTLRDMLYFSMDNKLEKNTLTKIPETGIDQACNQAAIKITAIKNRDLTTKEQINNANTDIIAILSELLPDEMLENQADLTQLFLDDQATLDDREQQLWECWHNRRISRAASLVATHKVVFFKGEAGTGKSHSATQIAKKLNPDAPSFLISASSEIGTKELFGQDILNEDSTATINFTFKQGKLLEWANTISDKPITLIIDEANLAPPAIWDNIKTIFHPQPHIFCHGRRINLTENHRIIMTGNPETSVGRANNNFIKEKVPEIFFRELPKNFQKKIVVEHELNQLVAHTGIFNNQNKQAILSQLSSTILSLYQQYHHVLPKHDFTPRDLTDCCSYISSYLLQNASINYNEITVPMLNAVIAQAMEQTIGCKVDENELKKKSGINFWYNNKFALDNTIINKTDQQFDDFLNDIIIEYNRENNLSKDFNLSNKVTLQMLKKIWLVLMRRKVETDNNIVYTGRHAFEIEGPPGIGKDKLINLALRFFSKKYNDNSIKTLSINAGTNTWLQIQEAAKEAFNKGYTLSISEANCIPSNIFEGTFNSLFTEKSAPGFLVFITGNSSNFSGRQKPTAALQSRTTSVHMSHFDQEDLTKICNQTLNDKDLANKLSKLHCTLINYFQKCGLPQRPAVDDLLNLTKALKNQPVTAENITLEFNKIYAFYLDIARKYIQQNDWSDIYISNILQQDYRDHKNNILGYQQNLSEWLITNFIQHLDTSIFVMSGINDKIETQKNYLCLSAETLAQNEFQQKTTTFKLLVEHLWQNKLGGLTDCPIENNDTATAVYKKWKQHFAKNIIASSNINERLNLEDMFTLNEKEQLAFESLGYFRQIILQSLFKLEPTAHNINKMQLIITNKAIDKNVLDLINELAFKDIHFIKSVINRGDNQLTKQVLNIILSQNQMLTPEYLTNILDTLSNHDSATLNQALVNIEKNSIYYKSVNSYKNSLLTTLRLIQNRPHATENTNAKIINQLITKLSSNNNNNLANNLKNKNISNTVFKNLLNKSDLQAKFSKPIFKKMINLIYNFLKYASDTFKYYLYEYILYAKKEIINEIATTPLNRMMMNNTKKQLKDIYGINTRVIGGFDVFSQNLAIPFAIYNYEYSDIFKKNNIQKLAANVKTKLENLTDLEKQQLDNFNILLQFFSDLSLGKEIANSHNDLVAVMQSTIPEITEFGIEVLIEVSYTKFNMITEALGMQHKKNVTAATTAFALTSRNLTTEKAIEFITRIENNNINLDDTIRAPLKMLYSYLLKYSLENINKHHNRESSIAIIHHIINAYDFERYLNGSVANYLYGIFKLNIPELSPQIKQILDNHYNKCLDKPINMAFKQKQPTKNNNSIAADFTRKLQYGKSKHLNNILNKLHTIKTKYSWEPSSAIDIAQLAKGKPCYKSSLFQSKNSFPIFIAGFPYIQNMDTKTLVYHEATNNFISFSALINEKNIPSLLQDQPNDYLIIEYAQHLQKYGINNITNGELIYIHNICHIAAHSRYHYTPVITPEALQQLDQLCASKFKYVQEDDINKMIFEEILNYGSIIVSIVAEDHLCAGNYKIQTYDELKLLKEYLLDMSPNIDGEFFSLSITDHQQHIGEYDTETIKRIQKSDNPTIITSADLKQGISEFIKSLSA